MNGITIGITVLGVWCGVSLLGDWRRARQGRHGSFRSQEEVARGPVPGAIEHVIITTGASCTLRRSDVDVEDILEALSARYGRRREPFSFPNTVRSRLWDTGWTLNLGAIPSRGGWLCDLVHDKVGTVARCWLCLESKCSDAMWGSAMYALPDERVIITRPNGVPWLAMAVISDSATFRSPPGFVKVTCAPEMLTSEILKEVASLGSSIAWAIVETEWPKNEKPATRLGEA